jgi:integrase
VLSASRLTDGVRPRVRPSTYESYARLVDRHLIPHLGSIPLAHLSPQQVQAWVSAELATGRCRGTGGLAPRTVQYARAVLRSALKTAMQWGAVTRNVATLIDAPRVPRYERQPLTPAQARTFLTTAQGHRLSALFAVAVACGLRKGEMLGLAWTDVDLDAGRLHVRRALQRARDAQGAPVFAEPKSARGRRTLALPSVIVDALKAHRVRQLEERLAAGGDWQDTGLVFTTPTGTVLDEWRLRADFDALLATAAVPRVRFHDLRHSCASFLLAQGVSPRTVMDVLGHSHVSLTLNTYGHLMPGAQEDAAVTMNTLLRG